MNYAIVLAAGVGQRMRNGGLPKQFLKLNGKPIIVYTLEKFEDCEDIDKIVVVCHGSYVENMQNLINMYHISKATDIIVGGTDRQSSLKKGLTRVKELGGNDKDMVMIHDGVRPLVSSVTIAENIRVAKKFGCAITVHQVTESVVITASEDANISDFKKRDNTYSLTAPQTFRLGEILDAYDSVEELNNEDLPLLDAAMVYAKNGGQVKLVKEQNANIKITTPEDFYILRSMIELEEDKFIFGL